MIAFLFPGQGSQYIGMGKTLTDRYAIALQTFEEASDSLGFDLLKLCTEGTLAELTKTANAQPAILTASVAAFRVFMNEFGIIPDYAAGHSLGEFSALACAGALSFTDAVRLVRHRGQFMQEAVGLGSGAMAAVTGLDADRIQVECGKFPSVGISNYNSPDQTVISGLAEGIKAAAESLSQLGATVIPLKVSAPFHSPLMEEAAIRLEEQLAQITVSELSFPVISNVIAMPYGSQSEIATLLTRQMTSPVQWVKTVHFLERQGVKQGIELGPAKVLQKLMQHRQFSIDVFAQDSEEDMARFRSYYIAYATGERHDAETASFSRIISRSLAVAVCIKNNNWNNTEYHNGVVVPYREIQRMQTELAQAGKQAAERHAREALAMLKSVFDTKKLPVAEQQKRFRQLLEETNAEALFGPLVQGYFLEALHEA
ncbi:ACP S-malonyltransferase [Paenibacillus radicis (ex Gao et al. 2016)]|uniref:[acyl-carrier-protein] S-malonyltransferase n=1 Tax=Paenibacillus radicis (ex Gao et al. 2016) TaxID=1737354 RepID=A0A917MBX4_9BACL|nr:ACP S-malonyltransferase [Paenibacillus radicis (ex Gao et al. 2016)]GGG90901.1 hypothetical protein GCM10010918_57420 [Paenibacillus radicis (ex Gao et al. 2016)]